jgi:hypothetical protein
MTIRTELKAGGIVANHNETLQTRTGLKAGARKQVRDAVKTTARKEDRLELMVVRAGLRAGKPTESL